MKDIKLHPEHGLNPMITVCFFCNKEKNEIALLGAGCKGAAPMRGVLNMEPCDECADLMRQGILLISVRDGESGGDNPYRTGRQCVITESAARRMFGDYLGKHRMAFVPDTDWDAMGLP